MANNLTLGRLPDGKSSQISKGLNNQKIINVVVGEEHVLALDINGQVYSWGRNDLGQLGHQDPDGVSVKTPLEIVFFKGL